MTRSIGERELLEIVKANFKKLGSSGYGSTVNINLNGDSLRFRGFDIPDRSEIFYPKVGSNDRSPGYAIFFAGKSGVSFTIRGSYITVQVPTGARVLMRGSSSGSRNFGAMI